MIFHIIMAKRQGVDHINLSIAAGQKVGLVGQSEAGKLTLLKLILWFYDVDKGAITIDGHIIAVVTQYSLRPVIGMVQQDSSLLHRTLRENIIYDNPNANEGPIISAAKKLRRMILLLD